MNDFRKLTITLAVVLGAAMSATAQTPATTPQEWQAHMDQQITAMRGMHEQMANAKTTEERNALLGAHYALMQNGMQMMDGMGPGSHGMGRGMGRGMGPGGAGQGAMHDDDDDAPADWATRQQWMEKRMEMMRSMMQLMVDRLPPEPEKK